MYIYFELIFMPSFSFFLDPTSYEQLMRYNLVHVHRNILISCTKRGANSDKIYYKHIENVIQIIGINVINQINHIIPNDIKKNNNLIPNFVDAPCHRKINEKLSI